MPNLKQKPTELTVGFSFSRPYHGAGTAQIKRTAYSMGGAFRIIGGPNAGVYYRHGDHLGSTSVISDANGLKIPGSDVKYAPFGEMRSGELSALTDFGYTGQRLDRLTGGLMDYGARYYLPGLRRFISADTVVPGPANPQAFNRYTYVSNNPISFIDPSGHEPEKWTQEWWEWRYYELELWQYEDPGHDIHTKAEFIQDSEDQLAEYGVTFDWVGTFSGSDKLSIVNNVLYTVTRIGSHLEQIIEHSIDGVDTTPQEAFMRILGPEHILHIINAPFICLNDPYHECPSNDPNAVYGVNDTDSDNNIFFAGTRLIDRSPGETIHPRWLIAHEFMHDLQQDGLSLDVRRDQVWLNASSADSPAELTTDAAAQLIYSFEYRSLYDERGPSLIPESERDVLLQFILARW